jgi:hypothetical protein
MYRKKEENKMIKTNLENIIKELDKALTESSELIFTNDSEQENNDSENLKRQGKKLEAQHKKLYEMLIIAKKLLKGLDY